MLIQLLSTRKTGMLNLLRELVEIETPSTLKPAVDALGMRLADLCRERGAQVESVPCSLTGNHLIARWACPASEGKGILLLHHMDTVFPLGSLAKMPYYEKDGKIFGPGVSDMKGGITVTLSAISALTEAGMLPARDITALFTSDEEIGSATSRALIEGLAQKSALVLVLEPGMPDGSLKVWRKGTGDYVVKVKGRAAHAGAFHEEGRNAIEEMAHQILAIQKLTDYKRGTTLNVGRVQGGTANNVVPEECTAHVDMRVSNMEEFKRLAAAMQALKPVLEGTHIEITGGMDRPPMPFDDTMNATFEKAQQIAAGLGMNLTPGGTGGGSDANFVAPLGIPVLDGLGPVGEGAHSEREFIYSQSLVERATLLAALLHHW